MIIKNVDVPPEWGYLFDTVIVKQAGHYSYNGKFTHTKIRVYAYLKSDYVQQYQAYCAIDPDFKFDSVARNHFGNCYAEYYICGDLLPFSERFFVPNIFNIGFEIPVELAKKLVELSETSKPIT